MASLFLSFCTGVIFLAAIFCFIVDAVYKLPFHLATASAVDQSVRINKSTEFSTIPANAFRMPPQRPPSFLESPSSIIDQTRSCIEANRNLYDSLATDINETQATFENTLLPIAQAENICDVKFHILGFYKSVASDDLVRKASLESVKMIEAFEIQSNQHRGLFKLVSAVARKGENLAPEQQRLLDDQLRRFKQHGLQLASPQQTIKYQQIQAQLSDLRYSYAENLKQQPPKMEFSEEELEEIPDEWLSSWLVTSGSNSGRLFQVPLGQAEVSTVLQYAAIPETRKRVYLENEKKNHKNAEIFAEIVNLRNGAARLAGYRNHADSAMDGNMVRSFQEVNKLLASLKEDLQTARDQQLESLKEIKGLHREGRLEPSDNSFYLWDHQFYSRLQAEEKARVDGDALVSTYLPLEQVLQGLIQLIERLFGIKFDEIEKANHNFFHHFSTKWTEIVWDEKIRLLAVWDDSGRGKDTNCFLGYLYLDLFPRAGKFGHVANFLLQPGFEYANGTRWFPVTALLGNFAGPSTVNGQVILRLDDIVSLFHEFGHAVHNLVSKTTFSRFHGTRAARDFVETPSQLMENWCWEESVLQSTGSYSFAINQFNQSMQNNNSHINSSIARVLS